MSSDVEFLTGGSGGGGSGITQLTGDVTAGPGSGVQGATVQSVANIPDGSIARAKLGALGIVDGDVAAGAGIAKSKLGALGIIDGDVAAGAAIAQSKLSITAIAWALLTGAPATFTPSPHEPTHVAGGSDPLPWGTVLGAGNDASKPAAAASNSGYLWIATDTSKIYQSSGAAWVLVLTAGATGASTLSIYGDGSDGTATLDGTTAVAGMVPSGNVYTAARDLFFAALTVNGTVQLNMNGFRLRCRGTITNNGVIQNDGNPASGNTAGAAQAAGSIASTGTGAAGGGGGGTGVGASGLASVSPSEAGQGGAGGAGNSGGFAAGNGGAVVAPTAIQIGARDAVSIAASQYFYQGTSAAFHGGSGGGGGGGSSVAGSGGAGGGGGGPLVILANAFAGTGAIHSRGGAGANAVLTNGGAGGGGGGGAVYIVSGSVSGGAIPGQTIDANGGTGGTGLGTGANGTAGSAGLVRLVAA